MTSLTNNRLYCNVTHSPKTLQITHGTFPRVSPPRIPSKDIVPISSNGLTFPTVCPLCGLFHDPTSHHHFEYSEHVEVELTCEICMQPLLEPVDTPCQHTFCLACLRNHLRLKQYCPTDRIPLNIREVRQSSYIVRKLVSKLAVICPNKSHCQQVVPRKSLEAHLKNCQGVMIICPKTELGCNFTAPRCLMEKHLWKCLNSRGAYSSEICPGVETIIDLPSRCPTPLGLHIVGGCDSSMRNIMIQSIDAESTAALDGRLQQGDTILEINGHNSTNLNFTEASHILHSISPLVTLRVLRGVEHDLNAILDDADIEVAELQRGDEDYYDIEFCKHRSFPGIYISNINDVTFKCGDLYVSDRVLDVCGHDMRFAVIDELQSVLNSYPDAKLLVTRIPEIFRQKLISDLLPFQTQSAPHVEPFYDEIPLESYKEGEIKNIVLQKKTDEFYGMNVSGGLNTAKGDLPIFISGIKEGGLLDKTPCIGKGDIIISINSISLLQKTHYEAVEIIKASMNNITVKFKLIHGDSAAPDPGLSYNWSKWLNPDTAIGLHKRIVLSRDGDESLGFSLIGGRNSPKGDCPLHVHSIIENGLAYLDGRLKEGDAVTSIDNKLVYNCTLQVVVNYIRRTRGDIILCVTSQQYNETFKTSEL